MVSIDWLGCLALSGKTHPLSFQCTENESTVWKNDWLQASWKLLYSNDLPWFVTQERLTLTEFSAVSLSVLKIGDQNIRHIYPFDLITKLATENAWREKKNSIVDKRTCTAIHITITYLTITVALLYLSHWTRPLLVQHLHYCCCLKVTYPTHLPKDLQVPFKTKQQQRQRDQNTAAYDEGKVCFLSSLSMHCFGRKHLCLLFFQF